MAIATLYEFPDMTQEHYDRLLAETYGDDGMPGVIAHAAGPLDGGGGGGVAGRDRARAPPRAGPPGRHLPVARFRGNYAGRRAANSVSRSRSAGGSR